MEWVGQSETKGCGVGFGFSPPTTLYSERGQGSEKEWKGKGWTVDTKGSVGKEIDRGFSKEQKNTISQLARPFGFWRAGKEITRAGEYATLELTRCFIVALHMKYITHDSDQRERKDLDYLFREVCWPRL